MQLCTDLSVKFKEKYPTVSLKIRVLLGEIWQRLEADTALFLSAAEWSCCMCEEFAI